MTFKELLHGSHRRPRAFDSLEMTRNTLWMRWRLTVCCDFYLDGDSHAYLSR